MLRANGQLRERVTPVIRRTRQPRALWLNDVLEGQAKRIAYTLHSEAGQLLASAHMALAQMAEDQPAELSDQILNVRGLLTNVEERLRHISHELRPPILDDLGLVPALEFLAKSAAKRWGLAVNVEATPLHRTLGTTIETTLYRVAQEGLTNVARHADATHVEIMLRKTSDRVRCSVRDNGIGFRVKRGSARRERGLGLMEIRERIAELGGSVCLSPIDRHGTDLTVEIPLEM
jgi:signal transduction histidine kinase